MSPHMTSYRKAERGAALISAMLVVTLVATLASVAMWQQWRHVEVESALSTSTCRHCCHIATLANVATKVTTSMALMRAAPRSALRYEVMCGLIV